VRRFLGNILDLITALDNLCRLYTVMITRVYLLINLLVSNVARLFVPTARHFFKFRFRSRLRTGTQALVASSVPKWY
jgi:hypothetical protein